MSLNPGPVELAVHGTSVLSRTCTKYTQRFYKLICLHLPTDCFKKISLQLTVHIAWVLIPFQLYMYFILIW